MKLDLVEINKLSPPGLWDLASLSAVIAMLQNVVKSGIGGSSTAIIYMRMIVGHSKSLRAKTRENLNMRIKSWVMQHPVRRLWVRQIIGEAAIKKWHKNRLADYALSKHFGDWKRKWPNGFERKEVKPRKQSVQRFKLKERAYNWKPFALKRILNVERFLYGRLIDNSEISETQTACQKLWNVDILGGANLPTWSQPRQRRILNPVRFAPCELVAEAPTGFVQSGDNAMEKIENQDGVLKEMGVKKLPIPPDIVLPDIVLKEIEPEKNGHEENKLAIEEQKPP